MEQPGGKAFVNLGEDFAVYVQVNGEPLIGFEQGRAFSGQ